MKIKLCPRCKSARITAYAGFVTGQYKCQKCGYLGPLVMEIEEIKKRKQNGRR